jgi:transglutaminase-like putative cysteine protease
MERDGALMTPPGRIPVLGVLVATALTGLLFGPTFGSFAPAALVIPLVGVVVAGLVADSAARAWPPLRRGRSAVMVLLGLLAIIETTLRSSTLWGLPTVSSVRALYSGVRRSWMLTLQTTSPARPEAHLVVFVPLLVLVAAVVAGWVLDRGRRLPALLPGLAVAGVAHAFRTVSMAGAVVLVVAYTAAAVAVLVEPLDRPGSRARDRVAGLAALPGVAVALVLGAFLGGFADPGHQPAYSLRDHVPSVAAPGSALSPLDEIAYRLEHSNDPVFSARGSAGTATWRLAVYDRFDGRTWMNTDHLRYLGARIDPLRLLPVPTTSHSARVLIDALPGPWVPSQAGLTSVSGLDPVIDERTGVLQAPGVKPFSSYQVHWTSPDLAQVDLSGSSLARDVAPGIGTLGAVPPSMVAVARAAVGTSPPTFRTALMLERYLREHYRPALGADLPSGHSWTELVQFLGTPDPAGVRASAVSGGAVAGSAGTSEQFAASYVVLARIVGIPARLAVGFRQPAQADPDGVYVVRNGDVLAWPEVAVRGVGWVPMDPMGRPGGGAGQDPTTVALDRARATLPRPPSPPPPAAPKPPATALRSGGIEVSTVAGLAWRVVLIGVAGWLLGVPVAKWLRTQARRRRVGSAAVLSAWLETRDRLRERGVPVTARMTVREVAAAGAGIIDPRAGWALDHLGGLVDDALWSGVPAGRPGVDAAWQAAEAIRDGLSHTSLLEQVAMSLDVRSLRRVH